MIKHVYNPLLNTLYKYTSVKSNHGMAEYFKYIIYVAYSVLEVFLKNCLQSTETLYSSVLSLQ